MESRKKSNKVDSRKLKIWVHEKAKKYEGQCNNSMHLDKPPWLYPNSQEKNVLCQDLNISRRQLDNWFSNYRRENNKKKQKNQHSSNKYIFKYLSTEKENVIDKSKLFENINMIQKNMFDFSAVLKNQNIIKSPRSIDVITTAQQQLEEEVISGEPELQEVENWFSQFSSIMEPQVEITPVPFHPQEEGNAHQFVPLKEFREKMPQKVQEACSSSTVNECIDWKSRIVTSEAEFLRAYEGENKSVILRGLNLPTPFSLLTFLKQFHCIYPTLPILIGYLAFQNIYPNYTNNK